MTDAPKIADILERIDRIERATGGGMDVFLASEVIQDAVVRNIEVIGEAAKNVSENTRRRYPDVPWREMARFRDLAIHQYGRVQPEEVWAIVENELHAIRRSLGHPKQ